MWIDDIAKSLPEGFHDSYFEKIEINYIEEHALILVDVWIGDMDMVNPEVYRRGLLEIEGLVYFIIEQPIGKIGHRRGRLSTTGADKFERDNANINKCRFFINVYNSFIHIAGKSATFKWIEAERVLPTCNYY
jgi:hypothetical protein